MSGVSETTSPMSPLGRCCRKSRKSNEAKNLANVDFWTTPLLRRSAAPIRRSVVAFLRSDGVPHVAAPETHQQLWKISFVCPKRLFRQYRPNPDIRPLSQREPLCRQWFAKVVCQVPPAIEPSTCRISAAEAGSAP